MMFHSSFSQNNRKSNGYKAKRIILFSSLLGVVLWLSYQVKHSYDVKREYDKIDEVKDDDSHRELFLGRKFHPGLGGGLWEDNNSGLKDDGNTDDTQEDSSKIDDQSQEGIGNKEDNGNHIDAQINDGDIEKENYEAVTVVETSVTIVGKEHEGSDAETSEEGSESKINSETQYNGEGDTNGDSGDSFENRKDDASREQDENPEGTTSQELHEDTNLSIDEKERDLEETEHNNQEKKDDATQEQIETGEGIDESQEENGEATNDGQSVQIVVSESIGGERNENATLKLEVIEGTTSDDNSSSEKPEGDRESKAADGDATVTETAATEVKTNDETSASSYKEMHIELPTDHENSSSEPLDSQGDHPPGNEESRSSTIESSESNAHENMETNILMVTSNDSSKLDEVNSRQSGWSETKAVENVQLDGENMGLKPEDGIGSELVHPLNEEAKTEENGKGDSDLETSSTPVVSSNEMHIEHRKEEF